MNVTKYLVASHAKFDPLAVASASIVHLPDALQTGDLYVVGAESFSPICFPGRNASSDWKPIAELSCHRAARIVSGLLAKGGVTVRDRGG
jgi:hypothetical protein